MVADLKLELEKKCTELELRGDEEACGRLRALASHYERLFEWCAQNADLEAVGRLAAEFSEHLNAFAPSNGALAEEPVNELESSDDPGNDGHGEFRKAAWLSWYGISSSEELLCVSDAARLLGMLDSDIDTDILCGRLQVDIGPDSRVRVRAGALFDAYSPRLGAKQAIEQLKQETRNAKSAVAQWRDAWERESAQLQAAVKAQHESIDKLRSEQEKTSRSLQQAEARISAMMAKPEKRRWFRRRS